MGYLKLLDAANPLRLWPGAEDSAAAFLRTPLWCDGHQVGSVDPAFFAPLLEFSEVFGPAGEALEITCPGPVRRRSAALGTVCRRLHEAGFVRGWREELLAIAASEEAPKLFEIERAAARFFGFLTHAAHLNGLTPEGVWIARRSPDKPTDPGLLDNLVAGGVAAGMSVHETLLKEAWEEAGLGAELMSQAHPVAHIGVCRLTPEGLQREILYAHDLHLPDTLVPENQDGEVAGFHREPLARAAALVQEEAFTLDAALVQLDCLIRAEHPGIGLLDIERFEAICQRPN
jgi:8-oxo-dGTP pyrophosphatase MutT (NUDIX family)